MVTDWNICESGGPTYMYHLQPVKAHMIGTSLIQPHLVLLLEEMYVSTSVPYAVP